MNEKSEQINVRASQQVAEELRAEAQRRDLPLGETLEQLLALARADRQTGTWLELDPVADAALRSVAAAAGVDPATQLARMVRGRLREQLLGLASRLDTDPGTTPVREARSASAAPGLQKHAPERASGKAREAPSAAETDADAREDPLERVGVFTVFD